jgi:nucleoside phosphorylase/CheY-like chemotaxis protein
MDSASRILIVDDRPAKYRSLIERLAALGFERDRVQIATSAMSARETLQDNQYILMILDILIPLYPEEETDSRHAIDLLVELRDTEELRKPGHIVGISADETAARLAGPVFEEQLWTVIQYREDSDEWTAQVVNCVLYLCGGQEQPTLTADIAIVCALRTPELQAVLKLPWEWSAAKPIDDVTFVHEGKIGQGDTYLRVVATSAPRMGMVSVAILASKLISLVRPKVLAMTGVCAGVKGKVRIGDVVLFDPSWDYQSGKRVRDRENTQFSIAPNQLCVPEAVRAHVEQLKGDSAALADIASRWGEEAPAVPRVVVGPGASGSAVLADGEVVSEIKEQHRELCAIEMEAYGLYAAAHAASPPQPLTFALKGVCDFADPDKDDQFQAFAAYASAAVLRLLFERFGERLVRVAER